MPLKNLTKKTVISNKIGDYKSNFSKATGLMFRKKLENKALIFCFGGEKLVPLHMLFVFYPIDVLFLDKEKAVVEMKEDFRPFTFYMPKHKAKFVVEVPNGTIKNSRTETGDKIGF